MLYATFKIIHLLGVILLIGNVTVTAWWKIYADRTRNPVIIAHAQRLVTITDWAFTFWGIVLTVVGGYGAGWLVGLDPIHTPWIVSTEILFVVSGVIWLGILLPIQFRQARQARQFAVDGLVPESYYRAGRIWLAWGLVATVPLIGAVWLMVYKSG